ncbi:Lipid A biosynthesis lauroyltransferase [Vibrio stylophorae]|uniref:Lipid A biosynthesis lauroyltransferase n=1 Tax=Vibrio stylophorae TaxID=659351 RepID=A0ABN8DUG2_9VIBR|nr:glycosyltransferase family 2 protein [Vibrio stylophorae]CAH0533973.1 Lipid A biosynthesis lauroyltransferase [Vibrio stylophorae]
MFHPCFLIPCYNHGKTLAPLLEQLAPFGHSVMIVDDGSDLATQQYIDALANLPRVQILRLPYNQGKGGAVIAGMRALAEQGFSHAIQIDADGQHNLADLPALLSASEQAPQALISGKPIYDQSVPKARLYGRYVTHVWVWIETLGLHIKDSMCGFRSYPLNACIAVLNQRSIGQRMDFDTELMVRLDWLNVPVRFIDTRVHYPQDGLSHFDALRDNLRISWMHTKLCCGMLIRAPRLIARHFRTPSIRLPKPSPAPQQPQPPQPQSTQSQATAQHWSAKKEKGSIAAMKLLLWVYRVFGRGLFRAVLYPVIGYYRLSARSAREASQDYLNRLHRFNQSETDRNKQKLTTFRHLFSYGETMLDKLAAWDGQIGENALKIHGLEHYTHLAEANQGIVLLGAHHGNLELCRALSHIHPGLRINALVFSEHAQKFNEVITSVNPDAALNLISVNHVGPELAMALEDKIKQGEWVVIMADRTSTTNESRVIWSEFLGQVAPFPQGPFILASLLKCPVYTLFGLRQEQGRGFDIYFDPLFESLALPRATRQAALQQAVDAYATRLQHYVLKAPLQWFNFFKFWQLTERK